jgi:predicted nucleic acid-binding protein
VLSLAQRGRVELFVSALSYVEVRGQGRADPYDADLDQRVLALLDSPRLIQIDFHRALAIRARGYTRAYRLKNYDAVHLASAVEVGAEVLMSYDGDFPKRTTVDGVWIDDPYEPGDPALFPSV